MKILMLEWKSFGNEDIIAAFRELGHTVKTIPFSNKELHQDSTTEQHLVQEIRSFCPDFVFSFNYFPIVSLACKQADMRYVAWVYDNPYVLLYSYTIIYPGNFVFVFDKELYLEFHNAGIATVHYLPLAANTDRLSAMNDFAAFRKSKWFNQSDIAFVGSLYTEKHQFYQRLEGIRPYTRGYLEGIMAAQKQVYGYNFIQELLTPGIIEDLMRVLPMQPDPTSVESVEYLYAQYVINRQITATERSELLTSIGAIYPYDLYTPDEHLSLPGCINHGAVDYYDMAPYVFKTAKINLNISLRSIKSGIPLRAFDIMGAGGFLLTNYQADFTDCYEPDKDFVYFESRDDLLQKIEYYLNHEEERAAIARNGFEKTASCHTYKHRITEMLSYLS
ncbi:MAG: glycosyltransferase [Firmicutes bacterium]|nr:glycosyltransferase [Bacillota bacterium]